MGLKKIILEIGYGKSAITVFEDNRILYFNILPVGGRHITNDISLLLKISKEDAENLKKNLNQSETIFKQTLKSPLHLQQHVNLGKMNINKQYSF